MVYVDLNRVRVGVARRLLRYGVGNLQALSGKEGEPEEPARKLFKN